MWSFFSVKFATSLIASLAGGKVLEIYFSHKLDIGLEQVSTHFKSFDTGPYQGLNNLGF